MSARKWPLLKQPALHTHIHTLACIHTDTHTDTHTGLQGLGSFKHWLNGSATRLAVTNITVIAAILVNNVLLVTVTNLSILPICHSIFTICQYIITNSITNLSINNQSHPVEANSCWNPPPYSIHLDQSMPTSTGRLPWLQQWGRSYVQEMGRAWPRFKTGSGATYRWGEGHCFSDRMPAQCWLPWWPSWYVLFSSNYKYICAKLIQNGRLTVNQATQSSIQTQGQGTHPLTDNIQFCCYKQSNNPTIF